MADALVLTYLFLAALVVFHFRQAEMEAEQRAFVWRNLGLMAVEIALAFFIAYHIDLGTGKQWSRPIKLTVLTSMFFLIVHGVMRFWRVRSAVHEDDYDTSFEKVLWIVFGSVFGILLVYHMTTSSAS